MTNPAVAIETNTNPVSWWLAANAVRDPTKHTSANPMTISAGMFLVSVIDSPACGRVVLAWSMGSLGLFLATPTAIPLPAFTAWFNGRTTRCRLPVGQVPAMEGRLVMSTNSVAVVRNQPAPCHGQ